VPAELIDIFGDDSNVTDLRPRERLESFPADAVGWGGIWWNPLSIEDGGEAAMDHALPVERHSCLVRLHARVNHYSGPGLVPNLL
jgi:hypothetical protein